MHIRIYLYLFYAHLKILHVSTNDSSVEVQCEWYCCASHRPCRLVWLRQFQMVAHINLWV